jgi:hypothetical protein
MTGYDLTSGGVTSVTSDVLPDTTECEILVAVALTAGLEGMSGTRLCYRNRDGS